MLVDWKWRLFDDLIWIFSVGIRHDSCMYVLYLGNRNLLRRVCGRTSMPRGRRSLLECMRIDTCSTFLRDNTHTAGSESSTKTRRSRRKHHPFSKKTRSSPICCTTIQIYFNYITHARQIFLLSLSFSAPKAHDTETPHNTNGPPRQRKPRFCGCVVQMTYEMHIPLLALPYLSYKRIIGCVTLRLVAVR